MLPRFKVTYVFLSLIVIPPVLSAQAVTGIVANVSNSDRITGAEIRLLDTDSVLHAATYSGENGEFFIEASEVGAYVMEIRQVGFKGRSVTIVLQSNRVIEVRVNLAPAATEIEGITVYGQTAETPEQREFLSRRHLPWAYSFDREEIEQLRPDNIQRVVELGVPGGQMLWPCLIVYLDGRPSHRLTGGSMEYEQWYPLRWVYGIEVYRTYYDIPFKYREPGGGGCGALLIWSTTPASTGAPSIWSIGAGATFTFDRTAIEVGWRTSDPTRYVWSVRGRVGTYSPYDLLGATHASDAGYAEDARPLYLSAYIGKQGPLPFVPWKESVYARIAAGATIYGPQWEVTEPSGDSIVVVRPSVGSRPGAGAELGIGWRLPKGKVRPWIEVRTGAEFIGPGGLRWMVPVVTIGLEFGRGRREL